MRYATGLLLLLLVLDCTSEDDRGIPPDPVEGNWSLFRVSAGFGGVARYAAGDIVWTFGKEGNLIVTTRLDSGLDGAMLTAGHYSYATGAEQSISFADQVCTYQFNQDTLYILDHPEVDGPILSFEHYPN